MNSKLGTIVGADVDFAQPTAENLKAQTQPSQIPKIWAQPHQQQQGILLQPKREKPIVKKKRFTDHFKRCGQGRHGFSDVGHPMVG